MDAVLSAWLLLPTAAAACITAYLMGRVSAGDLDDELNSRTGMADRAVGLGVGLVFVCGFFVYAFLCAGFDARWLPAAALAGSWICCLCMALGRLRPWQKNGVSLFALLGMLCALPAKGLFAAFKLNAQEQVTEEDVLDLVDDVEEQDIIDEDQKKMITNIFALDEVAAGDIMTHRTELACVSAAMRADEIIRLSAENGYSRMPVYGKGIDDIVGILYVKDLFKVIDSAEMKKAQARSFMRPVMFVPEACRAQDLLVEFKKKHTQIAVVIDEYGGTAGIVTMEDVLEEIVGNIQDEFDNEEEEFVRLPDGSADIAGEMDLEDVFAGFAMPMPESAEEEGFDSVGGMITDRLGRIPDAGEQAETEYGGLRFTVKKVGERRIARVRAERIAPPKEETDDEQP